MSYYKGRDEYLLIRVNGEYVPAGCLTENSISENTEFIGTTTRENEGWQTQKPIKQAYSINFAGLQPTKVEGEEYEVDFISYEGLKALKRNKTLVRWKTITGDGAFIERGYAYIADLSKAAPADGWLTYTCTLQGFGSPISVEISNIFGNQFNTIFK